MSEKVNLLRNCSCGCNQVHSDDEHGTDFSKEQLAVGVHMQTVPLFEQLCYKGADDDNRMQVDSLKKATGKCRGRHPSQIGTRVSNTDVNTCKICGRTGHWVKDCWRPGGGAYDNSNTTTQTKAITTRKAKAKANSWTWCKRVRLPEQPQLSCPSQTPSTTEAVWCNPDIQQKGWHDNPFTVCHKETSWCRVVAS